MNFVTLNRTITLAGLMKRWSNKKIGDYVLDFNGIREIIRHTDQLPAYRLFRQLSFKSGNRICEAEQISYFDMMKNLTEARGFYEIIFNLDDIENFEQDNLPDTNKSLPQVQEIQQKEITLEDKIKMWENKIPTLTAKEQDIAKVVIGKFHGKSHSAICDEVFREKNIIQRDGKIRRTKEAAQLLANTHNLPMPLWDNRQQKHNRK